MYYPQQNQQLYVFFVDSSNAVRAISKAADRSWGGATILSLGDFVSRSSAITAVHYHEFGTLEVFAIDRNGAVNVIWRTPNADWNPPTALTLPGFASPGTPLAVVVYPLNSGQLELFTTNKSDVLHVLWKVQNNWWVPCPHALEPVAVTRAPVQVLRTMRVGQLTGNIDPEGWTLLNGDTRHWGYQELISAQIQSMMIDYTSFLESFCKITNLIQRRKYLITPVPIKIMMQHCKYKK